MQYRSPCRDCKCLHFFLDDDGKYPEECYCVEASKGKESKCSGYIPKDNLEYLEWLLEQKELV